MNIPQQVQPIARQVTAASSSSGGITPSGPCNCLAVCIGACINNVCHGLCI